MQTQRINIILPKNLLRQIDREAPPGKRSQFIAKNLAKVLSKKKMSLEESLKANAQFYKEEYKIWSVLDTEGWPE